MLLSLFHDLSHTFIHAILDTINVFIVIFIIYILLSFVEDKLTQKIEKNNKYSPIIGASIGLIPQCGFSVVSADLYRKDKISIGTLLAVFISCSDEALPILLSNANKIVSIIPMFILKFVIAIAFGYLIDLFIKRKKLLIFQRNKTSFSIKDAYLGNYKNKIKQTPINKHLTIPLLHSLKICIYVLIINLVFGLLIHYIGEDNIKQFLNSNIYITPLLATLIGLIPNCASSIIIAELYLVGSLPFAATLAGLMCNAGLGLIFLFKDKSKIKDSLKVSGLLVFISLFTGYITLIIELLIK